MTEENALFLRNCISGLNVIYTLQKNYIYKCLEDALLQVCLLFLMVFRVVLQIRKANINVLVFLCLFVNILFRLLTSNMFI